jgi:hypothetical protein
MSKDCCCAQSAAGAVSGCLVCGAPVVYSDERERECALCHGKFVSASVCENGHFVCDACHAASADSFLTFLRYTPERDPAVLLGQVMMLPGVHMHGPEHHRIVPAVLLAAFRNCGGEIDLPAALAQAMQRAKQVPGGSCGYWGVCGAAAGAGIYASVVTGSNPLNRAAWALPQKLTAGIIARIAEIGGVRCCKRTGFLAVETAASWTRETLGVPMTAARPVCAWSSQNRECLGTLCPYNPLAKRTG